MFNRNPRSRAVVQRSGPVPYCLLLRHVVMHHLQRSPCRLQENGTGISVNVRTVMELQGKNFDLFRERLLNVNLSSVDVRTRQEVHMFLTAIEKNPPVMNLNGYANINRKLISSVSRFKIH